MKDRINIYCAGGWFSKNQVETLETLEGLLRLHPLVNPYFPRHDGVKLKPDELHDSNLRKKVFEDNVQHILASDLVVAACDGRDGFYDTGTQWEIGFAMANNIPVIAYDPSGLVTESMKGICDGFSSICTSEDKLLSELDIFCDLHIEKVQNKLPVKILFIGPDTTEDQQSKNKDIVSSVILECHGSNFRWVDNLSSENLYSSIDEIFSGVDYLISVIDDRHPIVSWLMGQAYSRDIPTITYTNFNYGVNIMLLCSLLYHCRGKDELKDIMQKIRRDGIYSLPKFDDSAMKAM